MPRPRRLELPLMGRRLDLVKTAAAKLPALADDGPDPVRQAERFFEQGRHALAASALLPALLTRGEAGDPVAALAGRLLQIDLHRPTHADPKTPLPIAEDHLTQTVDRLVKLVRRQDAQIAALLALAGEAS